MSSELKTNKISPATGTALTLADSGDTLTLPSGATLDIASGATITNSGTATGFEKMLQVVFATTTTEVDTSTSSWLDLGLSASITPSATDSKVFAHWVISSHIDDDSGYYAQLVRDTTAVYTPATNRDVYANQTGSALQRIDFRSPSMYLDSPSTTSATTYKIQVLTYSTSNVIFQLNDLTSQLVLWEIGA